MFDKYIGIPYKWKGYDLDGCDCWGLVWLVEKEVFGNRLERHDELTLDDDPQCWGDRFKKINLGEEQPGDVMHMWGVSSVGVKSPHHVGVIIEKGKVLHIEKGTDSIVEDYNKSPRAKWRVINAYRIV